MTYFPYLYIDLYVRHVCCVCCKYSRCSTMQCLVYYTGIRTITAKRFPTLQNNMRVGNNNNNNRNWRALRCFASRQSITIMEYLETVSALALELTTLSLIIY